MTDPVVEQIQAKADQLIRQGFDQLIAVLRTSDATFSVSQLAVLEAAVHERKMREQDKLLSELRQRQVRCDHA